jgi:hypothetical protein
MKFNLNYLFNYINKISRMSLILKNNLTKRIKTWFNSEKI